MKTVLVDLPGHFAVRNFLFTPVVHAMGAATHTRFVLISPRPEDADLVTSYRYGNLSHETLRGVGMLNGAPGPSKIYRRLHHLWREVDRRYLFDSLTYRFNHLKGLANLRLRRGMSPAQRLLEMRFSNFAPAWVGWPLLNSRVMFRSMYRLRFGNLMPSRDPRVERVFDSHRPDALVLSRVQTPGALPLLRAARSRRVPVAGIVQTWDQPTTKGPLPPGCNAYIVGSHAMKRELLCYHGIPPSRVKVVGHTFLDNHRRADLLEERSQFLASLGVPSDHNLLSLCTNLLTMRAHEPSIARHLAEQIRTGAYGGKCSLVVRTHPQDTEWRRDFAPLHDPPNVVVMRASGFGYTEREEGVDPSVDMRVLANLMNHSRMVINTRGTISLDAIAFDTPVICLGFDGDLVLPEADRVIHRYRFEHFEPLVLEGGVWLVRSYAELDDAVRAYLKDPTLHTDGRAVCRRDHLEPFDGHASERLVSLMVRYASGTLDGIEATGYWAHDGLGRATLGDRTAGSFDPTPADGSD